MQCVKIHCLSKKKEEDVEYLAKVLRFDVDRSAQDAISIPDKSKIVIKIVYEDSGLAVPSNNQQKQSQSSSRRHLRDKTSEKTPGFEKATGDVYDESFGGLAASMAPKFQDQSSKRSLQS